MLTSIVLSMALAAPVPVAPPAPVASGPLPRLMEIKANPDGKVMVTVIRTEMQQVQVGAGGAIGPGGNAPAVIKREIPVVKQESVSLDAVKDLTITTADGKKVDVADAIKQLKDGAVVVVSTDGKPVSPAHLKLFKDDVLVLVSPELIGGNQQQQQLPGFPGKPIRPLPPVQIQPAPQILPIAPNAGGIQIQIQPGGVIQVAPALPAAPVDPAPAPAPEK